MIDISLNKITVNYGFGDVLKDISLDISKGEIVLIGPNGSGKTTVLKLIMGLETPTSGTIAIRKNTTLGYLNQMTSIEDDKCIVKDISINKIIYIENTLKNYEERMAESKDKELEKLIIKYTNLQEQFINLGGYEINEKIGKIVSGFKIEHLLDSNYNTLSGGGKRIVSFASLMIKNPDILLLDEPTNHIDITTREILEDTLNEYDGTILFVSHDRCFINKIANKIVCIQDEQLVEYIGNYDDYKDTRDRFKKI